MRKAFAQDFKCLIHMCFYRAQGNTQRIRNILILHIIKITQLEHLPAFFRQTVDCLKNFLTKLTIFDTPDHFRLIRLIIFELFFHQFSFFSRIILYDSLMIEHINGTSINRTVKKRLNLTAEFNGILTLPYFQKHVLYYIFRIVFPNKTRSIE